MQEPKQCYNETCRWERESIRGLYCKDGGGKGGRLSSAREGSDVKMRASAPSHPNSPHTHTPLHSINRMATTSTSSGTISLRAVSFLIFSFRKGKRVGAFLLRREAGMLSFFFFPLFETVPPAFAAAAAAFFARRRNFSTLFLFSLSPLFFRLPSPSFSLSVSEEVRARRRGRERLPFLYCLRRERLREATFSLPSLFSHSPSLSLNLKKKQTKSFPRWARAPSAASSSAGIARPAATSRSRSSARSRSTATRR